LGSEGIDEGIKKDIAASFLIDIAAGSVMEKADKDPSGKRVGSEKHDLLIKTVEQLALIGRRRRALYGKIWVDCANESIKNGKDIFKFRFSPSRKTSYVICARNSIGQEAAPILELMRIRMLEDASKMVVGISATAENILYTYDQVLSSINRAERKNKNTSLILDGTVILLEKR
jgi:hypothetical protein